MGITDPAEAYFQNGQWGWDGTVWRKLPLVWGYFDRWIDNLSGTQSNSGTYEDSTVAVPAGEVYVLEALSIRNTNTAPGVTTLALIASATAYIFKFAGSLLLYEPLLWTGRMTLKVGDQARVKMVGCLDNDIIQAFAWGYKMKVAE